MVADLRYGKLTSQGNHLTPGKPTVLLERSNQNMTVQYRLLEAKQLCVATLAELLWMPKLITRY